MVFNSLMAALAFTTTLWLLFCAPVAYVYFIAEDSWAEYASFAAWGMASCFLTWAIVEHAELRRVGPILFAAAAFFVAMEEISWGQRVIGVAPPASLAEGNLQGEMNLHNFFPVELVQYLVAGAVIFGWVMVFPVLRDRSPSLRRVSDALGIPLVPVRLWPLFLLAMVMLLSRSLLQSGETGELFLAIAVSAFALDMILTLRRGTGIALASTAAANVGMFAIQALLALFLTEFYGSPQALSAKLNLFASKQLPAVGMHAQAIEIFEYMVENPRHLEWDGRIRYGLALMELGRFDEAQGVLESSLDDQRFLAHTRPKVPDHDRAIGEVLAALDRPRESRSAFERAIEKDRIRLVGASNANEEAKVHWSLGKTYVALGDRNAAVESLARAVELPSSAKTRHRLGAWIEENFDEGTYTALIASTR